MPSTFKDINPDAYYALVPTRTVQYLQEILQRIPLAEVAEQLGKSEAWVSAIQETLTQKPKRGSEYLPKASEVEPPPVEQEVNKPSLEKLAFQLRLNLSNEQRNESEYKWQRAELYWAARASFPDKGPGSVPFRRWFRKEVQDKISNIRESSSTIITLSKCPQYLTKEQFLLLGFSRAQELLQYAVMCRWPKEWEDLVGVAHTLSQPELRKRMRQLRDKERSPVVEADFNPFTRLNKGKEDPFVEEPELKKTVEAPHGALLDDSEQQDTLLKTLTERFVSNEHQLHRLTKKVEDLGGKVESLTTQLGALLFKMEEILSQTVKQEEPAYKATHFSFEDDDFMDYENEDA